MDRDRRATGVGRSDVRRARGSRPPREGVGRSRLSRVRRGLLVVVVIGALLALAAPAGAADSRGCDPLDGAACLLPWPNDYFTRADSSTDTGRRLDLKAGSTPATLGGKPMAVTDFNRSDGFSPGSLIITRVPGLNTNAGLDLSGAARVTDPGRYRGANQPIVVIDAQTGRRWPVTSELDTQASSPNVADLLIRPAVNFREGRRYLVALRGLKTDAGAPIPAGAAFRVFRDRLPSSDPAVNARRPGMERIFRGLKRAGIAGEPLSGLGLHRRQRAQPGRADALDARPRVPRPG